MPYIVSPGPAPRTGLGDFSAALGGSIESGSDMLMRMLLDRLQTQAIAPSANKPGTLQYASGKTEPAGYNPAQMGAGISSPTSVRTSQGVEIPFEAIPQGQATFHPPTRNVIGPSLTRQTQQLQLQKLQQEMDPIMQALERRKAEASANLAESQSNYYKSASNYFNPAQNPVQSQPAQNIPAQAQPPSASTELDLPDEVFAGSNVMRDLYQQARAGDSGAARKIRMLALDRDDPIAQSLLKALGEY